MLLSASGYELRREPREAISRYSRRCGPGYRQPPTWICACQCGKPGSSPWTGLMRLGFDRILGKMATDVCSPYHVGASSIIRQAQHPAYCSAPLVQNRAAAVPCRNRMPTRRCGSHCVSVATNRDGPGIVERGRLTSAKHARRMAICQEGITCLNERRKYDMGRVRLPTYPQEGQIRAVFVNAGVRAGTGTRSSFYHGREGSRGLRGGNSLHASGLVRARKLQ